MATNVCLQWRPQKWTNDCRVFISQPPTCPSISQNLPRRWFCKIELACFRGPKGTKSSKPVNASALTSASNGLDHHGKTEAYQRWTPKMKGFLARGLYRSWQGPSPTSIGPLTSTWAWSSFTNSRWTFWRNDKRKVLHTKCCQHGHQFFSPGTQSL